ncbi:hypothetical protein VTN77DRAFT_5596 [Rasamsonia byssochlamydoides]|uniref:uncharacterized protein n=1 Tax=Rasamsonia byssochlamydoides TaxID=89139 RepID=UPI003743C93F
MPQRGEEVFCHVCGAVFPKDDYGLTCPQCESEFTEIIEDNNNHPAAHHQVESEPPRPSRQSARQSPRREESRSPASPFHNHNPWTEETEIHDVGSGSGFSRRSYRSPDGRFSFTSTTFSTGFPSRRVRGGLPDLLPSDDPVMRSFNAIFQGLAGAPFNAGHRDRDRDPLRADDLNPPWADEHRDRRDPFGGLWPRDADNPQPMAHPLGDINEILDLFRTDFPFDGHADRPTGRGGVRFMGGNPLSIIASILGGGRHGDAVYSQEELDRVISQLIDQNVNGNGVPPASQSAIRALPKKKVDREMLGPEGKAECSICMESVELGTEVTVLPCKHWFHFTCIEMWLNQHNTCPHCRRGINNTPQ